MKRLSLTRLLPRLVLTIGIALLLTPMAYAGGGAVSQEAEGNCQESREGALGGLTARYVFGY